MSIDINVLQEIYFAHDKPVPYQLRDGNTLNILPVYVQDYAAFYHSVGILKIDKNALNKVEYIQMKYLQFLIKFTRYARSELGMPFFKEKCVSLCRKWINCYIIILVLRIYRY